MPRDPSEKGSDPGTAATLYQRQFSPRSDLSVLHYLMRRGQATRVASMMYLPPVFAVVLELAWFGVVPSVLTLAGIAVTCAGVAMTVWRPRWK